MKSNINIQKDHEMPIQWNKDCVVIPNLLLVRSLNP